ncbi:hypothetical protein EMIT0P218_30240 [Pseudomonas sp. IT-P218]
MINVLKSLGTVAVHKVGTQNSDV